ncbi:MAG: hypothetical protein IKR81_17005 [Victivallales bacterium]|nr:hypothetical protein [Victivallales bacterium]
MGEGHYKVISVSTLEYHLVVLYLLTGDQEKAFLATDDAWRDGYRNWDVDVREQVRNYMLYGIRPTWQEILTELRKLGEIINNTEEIRLK